MVLLALIGASGAQAETFRIATFNTELSRKGPGLLLRDILRGKDKQVAAVAEVIAQVAPDVMVLQGIDHDHELRTLTALRDRIGDAGQDYPHTFALRPNTGVATGLDMDGDGRLGGPGDGQGWGRFAGAGGMAVLSRFPLGEARDLSGLIWAEQGWATLPETEGRPFPSPEARAVQRLSSVGHWIVPVELPGGGALQLMAFHAGPPVFDGPEDRNGKRNHNEIALWRHVLDGDHGAAPVGRFVVLGDANLDPVDGDGLRAAIRDFLGDARVQDPRPVSEGGAGAADKSHKGDPGLDTVDWPGPKPGNLRVDYVLPSADWQVAGAGVFWPAPGMSGHDIAVAASRHRLVWVDLVR